MQRWWRQIGLALLAATALELVVFDFRYFLPRLAGAPVVDLGIERLKPITNAEVGPDGVKVSAEGELEIDDVGVPIYSVTPHTDARSVYAVEVSFTDEASANSRRKTGVYEVDTSVYGSNTVSAVSSGTCKQLRLSFPMARERGLVVRGVSLNAPPLRFDPLRVLAVAAAILAIGAVKRRAPWARPADRWALPTVGVVAISLLVALAILAPPPPGTLAKGNDNYQLLAEAFARGRVDLLVDPPPSLQSVKNPYDPSQRVAVKPKPLWDVAWYKGRYYSYFGPAPAVLALLPVKLVTGRPLPTNVGVVGFLVVAVVAALDLWRRLLDRWWPDHDELTVVAGGLALTLGTHLTWLAGRAKFYELAVSAGIAFLFLGLDLFVSARGAPRRLALAGLAFGLMVASRANLVLYLAIVAPAVWADARRGEWRRVGAFVAPLAAIAALMMAYNAARFGSPFEMGNRFQLTVADQRWNHLGQPSTLVPGLFSYLAQPMAIDLRFPFVHLVPTEELPTWTPQYQYRLPILGVLWLPVLWPLVAVRRLELPPAVKRAVFAGLGAVAAILLVDIGLAGVAMRYTLDVVPMLTLGAVICGAQAVAWFQARGAGEVAARGFAALVGVTVAISVGLGLMSESRWLASANPAWVHRIELMFAFWR